MRISWLIAFGAACTLVSACKPPPTDADMAREIPRTAQGVASEPIASPDSEGAFWAQSTTPGRLIYGQAGQPPQLALACANDTLTITRNAPADRDAQALLALVGNGHIGRIPVDAAEINGRRVWQGQAPAVDDLWEPLAGPRQLIVTVPGAGTVTLNPSTMPMALIAECRGLPPLEIEAEASSEPAQ